MKPWKDMSILKHIHYIHELSSYTGPFAEDLNPRAVRESNRQVQAMLQGGQLQKWGKYIKHDDASHAAIGKYACQNGGAVMARYFSRIIIIRREIFPGL